MTEPIPPAVLDLLAAIRDALDVPLAHWNDADERARARILDDRKETARIVIAGILDDDHDIRISTEYLTERTAHTPITYTVWAPEQATDGGAR